MPIRKLAFVAQGAALNFFGAPSCAIRHGDIVRRQGAEERTWPHG
jgi:hypothetical protein